MDTRQIGVNILHHLQEQGKTQVDLANGLGTSKQVVNKIVKGRKAIRTEEIVAIAEYLNVSIEELVNGKQRPQEQELEAAHLYGKLSNKETADFILSLVSDLSNMEEELATHGLPK